MSAECPMCRRGQPCAENERIVNARLRAENARLREALVGRCAFHDLPLSGPYHIGKDAHGERAFTCTLTVAERAALSSSSPARVETEAPLRAENARMREALEEIREWAGGLGWLGSPQDERVEAECLAILARLALAADAPAGEEESDG